MSDKNQLCVVFGTGYDILLQHGPWLFVYIFRHLNCTFSYCFFCYLWIKSSLNLNSDSMYSQYRRQIEHILIYFTLGEVGGGVGYFVRFQISQDISWTIRVCNNLWIPQDGVFSRQAYCDKTRKTFKINFQTFIFHVFIWW